MSVQFGNANQLKFFLLLTKPPGSRPVNYLRDPRKIEDEDRKEALKAEGWKGRVPEEAFRQLITLKISPKKSWSERVKETEDTLISIVKGQENPGVNRWTFITHQTMVLIVEEAQKEKIAVLQNRSRDETQLELLDSIYQSFLTATLEVEVYLSRDEEKKLDASFQEGLKGFEEVLSLLKTLKNRNSLVESRVELLLTCLRDKTTLFPLLLLPLMNNSEGSSYGIDALLFTRRCFHAYSLTTSSYIENLLKLISKMGDAFNQDNNREGKQLIAALKADLEQLQRKWESYYDLFDKPAFKRYLELAEKLSDHQPVKEEECEELLKVALEIQSDLNFDYDKEVQPFEKIRSHFEKFEHFFEVFLKANSKREDDSFALRVSLFYQCRKQKEFLDFHLRDRLQFLYKSVEGCRNFHNSIWDKQKKWDEIAEMIKPTSSKGLPALDELSYVFSFLIITLKGTPILRNLFNQSTTSLIECRRYIQFGSKIPKEARVIALRRVESKLSDFLSDLKKMRQVYQAYSVQLDAFEKAVNLLHQMLAPEEEVLCDFVLHRLFPSGHVVEDKHMGNSFAVAVFVPQSYLSEKDDYGTLIDPLSKMEVSDGFIKQKKHFISWVRAFHKEQAKKEKKLLGLIETSVTMEEIERFALELLSYRKWINEQKRIHYSSMSDLEDVVDGKDKSFLEKYDKLFEKFYLNIEFNMFTTTDYLLKWAFQQSFLLEEESEKEEKKVVAKTPATTPLVIQEEEALPIEKKEEKVVEKTSATAPLVIQGEEAFPVEKKEGEKPGGLAAVIDQVHQKLSHLPVAGSLQLEDRGHIISSYQENMRTYLLPMIQELLLSGQHPELLKEQLEVFCEQGIKIALARLEILDEENKALHILYGRTQDFRSQQRLVSHDLIYLYSCLEKHLRFSQEQQEKDKRLLADITFKRGAELLQWVGAICKHEPLEKPQQVQIDSQSAQGSKVVDHPLYNQVQQMAAHLRRQTVLRTFTVSMHPDESQRDRFIRQVKFEERLKSLKSTVVRLDRCQKLATFSEIQEALLQSCICVEDSLHLQLIHRWVGGDNGRHIYFGARTTGGQTRPVKFIHNLQELFHLLGGSGEHEKIIDMFKSFRSRTSRYLSQDTSDVGRILKDLHFFMGCVDSNGFYSDKQRETLKKRFGDDDTKWKQGLEAEISAIKTEHIGLWIEHLRAASEKRLKDLEFSS